MDLIPKESMAKGFDKTLIVDGSNGVGGEKLGTLQKLLVDLVIEVRNNGEEGVLNEGVGADYVQKEKVVPRGFGPTDAGLRFAIYL